MTGICLCESKIFIFKLILFFLDYISHLLQGISQSCLCSLFPGVRASECHLHFHHFAQRNVTNVGSYSLDRLPKSSASAPAVHLPAAPHPQSSSLPCFTELHSSASAIKIAFCGRFCPHLDKSWRHFRFFSSRLIRLVLP